MFESPKAPWDGQQPCAPDLDEEPWLADSAEEPWGPGPAEVQAAMEALEVLLDAEAGRRIDDLGADATLDRVAAAARAVDTAELEKLRLAAHWVVLHPRPVRPGRRAGGGERAVGVGGEGTPEAAEFSCAELATVLEVSVTAAWLLMADAVDLVHRLPLVWGRVQAGAVHPWVARKIASATRRLDAAAAARVDAAVVDPAGRLSYGRLAPVLEAAILAADPELAAREAAKAAEKRGVWLGKDTEHGIAKIFGRTDAPDARAFDRALDELAKAMTILGDTDPHDVRRAKAVGVLADPDAAADLIALASESLQSGPEPEPEPRPEPDPPTDFEAGPGCEPGGEPEQAADDDPIGWPEAGPAFGPVEPAGSDPRRGCDLGRAVLVLHASAAGLFSFLGRDPDAGAGGGAGGGVSGGSRAVVRPEGLGPVTLDTIRRWLGHRHVTIRPVVDLNDYPAVDRYEIPAGMRAAVGYRSPASCFPWSSNLGRSQEIDHTDPYVGVDDAGPPGQTRLDNLGLLDKRLHRVKTHAGWQVTQPRNGVWIWRSPHGRWYLVDHTGTTPLGRLATADP